MHKLELKNIIVTTQGKKVADNVSLSVNSGEVHMLMGQNGSGKSSLVNALFGHPKYEIADGEISFDGEDITLLPTEKKAKLGLFLSMQYLPEIAGVPLSQFLYRASGSRESVIEFYGKLKERAEDLGIDTAFLSRPVNAGLSGGEKKQSEILQLSALNPKFAFLDEIDSGVDIDSLKKVYSAIEKMKGEGVGFLLITHNPGILKSIKPDFVHIMKDGKIVKSGGDEIIKEIEESGFNNNV